MNRKFLVLAAGLVLMGAPARAAVTFDFIFDGGFPLNCSSDGTVIAGNGASGGYIPFRWTQGTGFVSLGRPQFVGAGGTTGMSADGTRIASSIGSLDSSYTTQGLWTLGSGWQELMPPTPPDGGLMDGAYGNVYGLSGDGSTVVGLYWRPGPGNRAHASKWTSAAGVVDLGGCVTGQASRANGVNYDGSVIVGWVETPTGPWRPAAWDNGSIVLLSDYYAGSGAYSGIPIGSGEARGINSNGDCIVGFLRDSTSNQRAAVMWRRTGGVWSKAQILGWVDGSEPGYGINSAQAVSNDAKVVVGYALLDGSPFSPAAFIWTPETGLLDIVTWLANNGVLVDPNFTIQGINTMTPDGTKIFGYGQMLTPPYTRRAFRITNPRIVGVAPTAPVAALELSAPRPNPTRAGTRMEFALPTDGPVDLSVYDTAGRRVATLLHADAPAGRRSVSWDGLGADGRMAPAGLYFARLTTARGSATRRIVRVD